MEDISKKTPQVSIGMPVYNGEQFIREALDSLLEQTFADFELIISDNCSTDGTEAICREYAAMDSRIRYLRWSENRGGITNFMCVLNESIGEYFMWAAHDDEWGPDWLLSILKKISNKNNVAGFGNLLHIDERSSLIFHCANMAKFEYTGSVALKKIKFFLSYEAKGKANLFYAIYPRDVLLKVDIGKIQSDYVVIFNLLEFVSFEYVNGPVFYKRVHSKCAGSVYNDFSLFERIANTIKFDFKNLSHYIRHSSLKYRIILIVLSILKIIIAVKFHAYSFFTLLGKNLFQK